VPRELVFDRDYFDDLDFAHDPQATLRELPDYPNVFFTPRHGGQRVAALSAEILEALQNQSVYSSEPSLLRVHAENMSLTTALVDMDPPRHTPLRKPFGLIFSPNAAVRAYGGTNKCQAHARCWVEAPRFNRLDDEGDDVPPGLEEQAQIGADVCPEIAITLED
jgi:ferredoxin